MLEPAEISGYEHVGIRRKERWGVYLPSKSRLAGLDKITPADLAGEKVFTPRRIKTQGVREWLGEYFDKLDVYASYNLLYNAAMLVDCGIGAAIAIEGAAALSVWFSGHFSVCFSVACAWLRRAKRAALVYAKHTPRCQIAKNTFASFDC